MISVQIEEALIQARELAAWLQSDVELAATREEHIRLSARANEAENLAARLFDITVAVLKSE